MSADNVLVIERALKVSESLKREGQFADALQALSEAVRARFLADGGFAAQLTLPSPIDMIAIEKLADLAALLGSFEGADNLLQSLAMWYRRAGNLYFSDYISIKRTHLALGRGLIKEAMTIFKAMRSSIGDIESINISEEGLTRWENQIGWAKTGARDRRFLLACLYLEMGKLLSSLGQYKDALLMLIRGLMNAENCPQELTGNVALHLKLAVAAALVENGELATARKRLDDLRPQLSATQQPGLFARALDLSGKLDLLCGNFGGALENLRHALKFCLAYSFEKGAMAATLNLAHVMIYLNQTGAAQDILEAAQERAKDTNDETTEMRARFLLRMVQARSSSLADEVSIASPITAIWGGGEVKSARQGYGEEDFLSNLPQPDNFLSFFEERALGFQWRLASNDLADAARLLSNIKNIFAQADSSLIDLRLKILSGMLAYYMNDFSAAADIFDKLRPTLREMGLKHELWQAQRFLIWCWKRLRRSEADHEALAKETQLLLAEMTESLAPDEQAIFLLNKWTADEEYIAAQISELIKLKAELARSAWVGRFKLRLKLWRRLHELLEHIDRYKDALARKVTGNGDQKSGHAPAGSLWKRLLRHPASRATISFLVLPDRVLITRASWMRLDFGISPVTRIQVRELVRNWHEPIREFLFGSRGRNRGLGASVLEREPEEEQLIESQPDEIQSQLKTVSEQLAWALQISESLKSLPGRVRALTIVPDDSLHGFPFAAIIHEGKYLIESFALSIAFESGINEPRLLTSKGDYALTVGVSQGAGGYPPLGGVEEELKHVSGKLYERKVREQRLDDFDGKNSWADKASVLRMLENASLFHIACHGEFESNAPEQSGMVLIPEPNRTETLSLKDLSELNLKGLKHTTLSSCWSADNFVLPGRWVISLPETMWRAGSQSVLGCLWVVSDDVATALMAKFYDYLDDYPRDEALRRAQMDCLNDTLPDCEIKDKNNPLYWAGYNLYGDYRRLNL